MIRLELPWMPPSSNNAYVDLPRGGRVLTTEGKRFKRETTAHFATKYPKEMMFFKPNVPFGLIIKFHIAVLENKGFKTGKADSRYKKLDGGNRTKLLEDALKDAAGIDDSQFLWTLWEKKLAAATPLQVAEGKLVGEPPEKTELWVWNLEDEGVNPINAFLQQLG